MGKLRIIFYLSLILVHILLLSKCVTCETEDDSEESVLDFNCPSETESPNITILSGSKYNQNGFKYDALKIECKASYPIEWNFIGNKPNDIYVHTKLKVDNVLNITKRCYVAILSAYKWHPEQLGRTGNYSCRSLSKPNKVSSIYKFMKESDTIMQRKIIFNSPRSIKVLANPHNNGQVIIPCASNEPDINATLWMVGEYGNVTNIPAEISTHYDPKVGFLLTRLEPNISLAANYLCHTYIQHAVADSVDVAVLVAPEVLTEPTMEHVTPSNGMIHLKCHANERVEIKIVKSTQPIQSRMEETSTDNINEYIYTATADLQINDKKVSGEAICVSKSSGQLLHTWKFDTAYMCKCSWTSLYNSQVTYSLGNDAVVEEEEEEVETDEEEDYYEELSFYRRHFEVEAEDKNWNDKAYLSPEEVKGQLTCTSDQILRVNFTFLHCGNPDECKIKSSCLSLANCPFADKAVDSEFEGENGTSLVNIGLRSGIIKCSAGDYIHTQSVVANLDNMYFDKLPDKDLLKVVGPEDRVFVGDKMLFSCHGAKYQLTQDLIWAFEFKNKSISLITDIDKTDDKIDSDRQKIYRTSYIRIISSDIAALVCYSPAWNSSELKNHSLPLHVQDFAVSHTSECGRSGLSEIILYRNSSGSTNRTRAPLLVTNKSVTITNPVDKIKLVCRATYPVQWLHDNTLVNTTRINWSTCGSLNEKKVYETVLEINSITRASTGNYSCRKSTKHSEGSFVYLFTPGNRTSFVEEGRHISVVKNSNGLDPWVTFPCRITQPSKIPYLYMDKEDSEVPLRIKLGDNLKYDPTRGFLLDTSSVVLDSSTYFHCTLEKNSSTLDVLFTLHLPDGSSQLASTGRSHRVAFVSVIVGMTIIIICLSVGLILSYLKLKQSLAGAIVDAHAMKYACDREVIAGNDVESNTNGSYRRFS